MHFTIKKLSTATKKKYGLAKYLLLVKGKRVQYQSFYIHSIG